MRTKTTAALLALLLVLTVTPTAAAAEVGASGQCWNSDDDGGQDEASVDTEDGVTIPSITGAVFAVATFVLGTAEDQDAGSACDYQDCGEETAGPGEGDEDDACSDEDPDRKDYLEVHVNATAEADDLYLQVCYDGEPHPNSNETDPTVQHCPHGTPGGPE